MNCRLYSDKELQAWEERIQAGKAFFALLLRLRDLAHNTGSPLPTDSVMAKELKISEEDVAKLRHYALNELGEDEKEFIRNCSEGDPFNDQPDCPFDSWNPLAELAEALSQQEFPDFR
jgi:hypothetical protein